MAAKRKKKLANSNVQGPKPPSAFPFSVLPRNKVTNSNVQGTRPHSAFRFLALPRELRDLIYDKVIDAKSAFASLFRVNRQIYAESYAILLKKYSFTLVSLSIEETWLSDLDFFIGHLKCACELPPRRWSDMVFVNKTESTTQFKHFNLKVVIKPAGSTLRYITVVLVGNEELTNFVELVGRHNFPFGDGRNIRDMKVELSVFELMDGYLQSIDQSGCLTDIFRRMWWSFTHFTINAANSSSSPSCLGSLEASIQRPRWLSANDFLVTLGREYQNGLDHWDNGNFDAAVQAILSTERLLKLTLPTSQYLMFRGSIPPYALEINRIARAASFFTLASHITLAGLYIHQAIRLPRGELHQKMMWSANHHAGHACSVTAGSVRIAADLAILAFLHHHLTLALQGSMGSVLEATDCLDWAHACKRLIKDTDTPVLPELTHLLVEIQEGRWRTNIPGGLVTGTNTTVFINMPIGMGHWMS